MASWHSISKVKHGVIPEPFIVSTNKDLTDGQTMRSPEHLGNKDEFMN